MKIMITEDYCSFEVSKLLKEKGFLKEIDLRITQNLSFYDNTGLHYNLNRYYSSLILDKVNVVAPTHQMAMKWLRKEKDIFIEIEYINQKACGCTIIVQSTGDLIAKWNWDRFQYANENPLTGNTYEEAVEATLKYSLENLI